MRTFLLALWLASSAGNPALASYRHFYVDNADICNTGKLGDNSKPLVIGSGAAIIQLKSPSSSFQPSYSQAKRCKIHIKAPDKDHGLMAYVEEMSMRRSAKHGDDRCVDYIQFGRDDIIPFVTINKSDRYCGQVDGTRSVSGGISYEDPGGSLLVWISLGGRRQSSWWPTISVVNLTLVVTTYQKECDRPKPNYRRCADRSRCIYNHYFCDRHFNCLTDRIPLDEDGCVYEEEPDVQDGDGDGSGGSSGDRGESSDSLNSVTKTLVIVCSSLGVLLFLILYLKYRGRSKKSCCGCGDSMSDSNSENCEMTGRRGQPRSLEELHRLRQLRDTPLGEENVYQAAPTASASRPGRSYQQQESYIVDPARGVVNYRHGDAGGTRSSRRVGAGPGRSEDADVPAAVAAEPAGGPPVHDEPPPAYDDLFPEARREDEEASGDEEETPLPAASSAGADA